MYIADIRTAPLRPAGEGTYDLPLLDDGEVQVGIWEREPATFGGTTGDYDEIMYMVSGRVTVAHADGEYDIAPGTLWATPRQWTKQWTVHQTVRKMYVIDNRAGGAGAPAHLSNGHVLELGDWVPRPGAISGDPHHRSVIVSRNNQLECGIWEATPGTFPLTCDGYDEVFCVLSGHATVHIDGGMSFDMRPGGVLLTPAGTKGTWVVHETLRKSYAIVHGRG